MISLADFQKIDIRVCTVVSAERIPHTDKLAKLTLDCGEGTPRIIVSGIADHVSSESLVGEQYPVITNLEPRTIRGERSNGMILAVSGDDGSFALLRPSDAVPPGARVH